MEEKNLKSHDQNNLSALTKPAKKEEGLWDLIKFIVILVAIIVPFRMYIAQPFIVHGASMYPTFNGGKEVVNGKIMGTGRFGDYLIVDELSYLLRQPKRGEVIIFRNPKDTSQFFIKRIIGLPGETVRVGAGRTLITKTDGQSFVLDESAYLTEKNYIPGFAKLGADEYYVMGDNRAVSYDSRVWGALDRKLIKGRALIRLFPPTKISFLPGNENLDKKLTVNQ